MVLIADRCSSLYVRTNGVGLGLADFCLRHMTCTVMIDPTCPVSVMHQSFVTTAPPPHLWVNSRDDFSFIKALLKALHCGDLLRVIALLFIIVNSTGVYLHEYHRRHLPGTAGKIKRSLPCTLAPPIPLGGGRGRAGSGYKCWCIIKSSKRGDFLQVKLYRNFG